MLSKGCEMFEDWTSLISKFFDDLWVTVCGYNINPKSKNDRKAVIVFILKMFFEINT
jgi:hypothetical protein